MYGRSCFIENGCLGVKVDDFLLYHWRSLLLQILGYSSTQIVRSPFGTTKWWKGRANDGFERKHNQLHLSFSSKHLEENDWSVSQVSLLLRKTLATPMSLRFNFGRSRYWYCTRYRSTVSINWLFEAYIATLAIVSLLEQYCSVQPSRMPHPDSRFPMQIFCICSYSGTSTVWINVVARSTVVQNRNTITGMEDHNRDSLGGRRHNTLTSCSRCSISGCVVALNFKID